MYQDIVSSKVAKAQTLAETTKGAIPEIISKSIHRISGVDRFYGVAYVIDNQLYGTSVIALKAGQKDPSVEILQFFSSLSAISLRRKQAQDALREAIQFNRAIINSAQEGIIVYDQDLKVKVWNPFMEKLSGIPGKEVLGRHYNDVFTSMHESEVFKRLKESLKGKSFNAADFHYALSKIKDNDWILETSSPIRDGEGKVIGVIETIQEITERKIYEEHLTLMSFHDHLTGLYNRRFFEEELKRLDTERQLPLSFIMGDLNGLKIINDVFGHSEGDRLLKEVAEILKKVCRSDDILARWGGDEFVILLPKTSISNAEEIVERIKKECKKTNSQKIPASLSIGAATKETVKPGHTINCY